ncbi:FAD/NAD-P-binding domain-containing protein [Trametes coccinea BRFM310]|uniref:FAD/NAD-P-binding domain-containing protein n=1 Tax=Trametes coccinea (strain BRFM310) TaxID=1353009 RepID=A0A1Y2IKE1_TRAC3|nr:FAD/NAD-P-binding domain-containing protein [Trametes coccinea BRFM310]
MSEPLPNRADILIVGAGPTGLSLALALQQQKCNDVLIVDGAAQGENTSRAVAVHAATIEAFESIGCAESILQSARKISGTVIQSPRARIEMATFAPLAKYTKYPLMIAIPQHITEKILGEAVRDRGVRVSRPHKVISVQPDAENPKLSAVIFEDGHILRARVVVGADGARSVVRDSAKINWADPEGESKDGRSTILSQMIIADVTLENPPPWPKDKINLAVNGNAFLFVALPGQPYPQVSANETVYRIACGVPSSLGTPPQTMDVDYLQKLFDAWGPTSVMGPNTPRVIVKQPAWSSRFRTRSSIVDTFFTRLPTGTDSVGKLIRAGGPVMLIGDAAHIHPPIGGQGMNLGIRDAVRLAPVLAEYLRNTTSTGIPTSGDVDGPMKRWAEERRARGLTVIRTVKQLTALLAMPNETRWIMGIVPVNPTWIRDTFLGFMCKFTWWRARAAYQVSGLGNP